MANIYVSSVDGSDADNGTTWALAKATLTGALAIATSSDTIWLSEVHAESTAGIVTLTCLATPGLRILSSFDHTTEPPTALSTTASVAIGAVGQPLSINGFAFIYGVDFLGGTNSSANNDIQLGAAATPSGLILQSCKLTLRSATGVDINNGNTGTTTNDDCFVKLIDCTIKIATAACLIRLQNARVHIVNLAVDAAGSTPTTLFGGIASAPGFLLCESSDLSAEAFTNLVNVGFAAPSEFVFRDCKLPASIAVTTGTNPGMGGPTVVMDNCDSADTNYRLARSGYAGATTSEAVLVRTSGASDGVKKLAHKMVSASTCVFGQVFLEGPERAVWNNTLSAMTATVEIIHDSAAALTNAEVWIELHYLGTSGFPRATMIHDAPATPITTAGNQDASTVAWELDAPTAPNGVRANLTTYAVGNLITVASNSGRIFIATAITTGISGASEPAGFATAVDGDSITDTGVTFGAMRRQKLVTASFTPAEKGYIRYRVVMAAVSKTLYYDPKLTVA